MSTVNWLEIPPPRTLLPRRTTSPSRLPCPPDPARLRELAEILRGRIVDRFKRREEFLVRGGPFHSPALLDALDDAFDQLRSDSAPLDLDSEVQAVTAGMLEAERGGPVVPYWCLAEGLDFALEAASRWAHIQFVKEGHGRQQVHWLLQRGRPAFAPGVSELFDRGPWSQLRRAVAQADTWDYDMAREAAERIRDNSLGPVKCAISFAFPSEPQWAYEDAFHELQALKYAPGLGVPDHLLVLLASLQDAPMAERIVREAVERGCPEEAREFVWEIVVNLEARAEQALEPLGPTTALSRVREATKKGAVR